MKKSTIYIFCFVSPKAFMIRYPAVVKPRRTIEHQKNRKSVFEDAMRDNPWMVEVSKKRGFEFGPTK